MRLLHGFLLSGLSEWSQCSSGFPTGEKREEPLGTPVDEDPAPDYPMAHEAREAHKRNKPFLYQHIPNMYRDDFHPNLGYYPNLEIPSWERMDVVRFGHIFVWNTGAWFDPGCTNKILTYKSWGGRLLIGPWPHTGIYRSPMNFPHMEYDWVGEYIRFFDAILKEKDKEVLSEPSVRYYTIGDEGHEWRYEADFPVAGTTYPVLALSADGRLMEGTAREDHVEYKVRDDIMIYGPGMRMNRNVEKDMTEEDQKSLIFTSERDGTYGYSESGTLS